MRKKLKILVVEEEPAILNFVAIVLRMMENEVFEFSSPQVVMDVMNKINPKVDLLFTDFGMAGMNGDELIRIIKNDKPAIKTICMSGYDEKRVCEESGCNIFLLKPITIEDIKKAVDELFPPRSR